MPRDVMERWWLRVDKNGPNGCWIWTGARWRLGYGKFTEPGTQRRLAAHRWGYERLVGPVPSELQLDHLCRNPPCVNPHHLEPVTPRENVRRGLVPIVNGAQNRAKTHCPRGHEYTPENTYYRSGNGTQRRGRNCRACGAIVTRRRKAEARAKRSQTEVA